ncbi:MAG TPA: hypothetical protein VN699_15150, partial [Pirellulales bacterium]|nr:hypothetical protein [Pirellulales bacterium]
MAIVCPHCGGSIQLKAPKPGRYTPKCPKCEQPFKLTISENPAAAPLVAKAAPAPPAAPTPNETEATAPYSRAPAASDLGATGAMPNSSSQKKEEATAATAALSSGAADADATAGFELASGVSTAKLDDIPGTLGGYQVLKELGRGGMGAVYLARQVSLDRNVAVKVMRPEW